MVSVFSGGGNQSVLSATVLADSSYSGVEGEWSVSVMVENELGNSSEIVVVLQGECKLCDRVHSIRQFNIVVLVVVYNILYIPVAINMHYVDISVLHQLVSRHLCSK